MFFNHTDENISASRITFFLKLAEVLTSRNIRTLLSGRIHESCFLSTVTYQRNSPRAFTFMKIDAFLPSLGI